MPSLYLLGTGAATTDPFRTATMLAVTDVASDDRSTLLVDCGGDVVQRLQEAGASVDSVAGLIVTHAHPDHCSGFPLFVERMWLYEHHETIPVVGIEAAVEQAEQLWDAFSPITTGWDIPELEYRTVPYESDAVMWHDPTWKVTCAPVNHGIYNVGLRFEHVPTGRVIAYSCDTAPCDAVVHLAQDADVLIHEATGSMDGHSSAVDAAEAARDANADRLILVHLSAGDKTPALRDARNIFPHTELGVELQRIDV
jgi:ribonuclease Z